jgi:hypothetical protein
MAAVAAAVQILQEKIIVVDVLDAGVSAVVVTVAAHITEFLQVEMVKQIPAEVVAAVELRPTAMPAVVEAAE